MQQVISTNSVIEILQHNKTYLQDRFGLHSLVLFGSYARNQQKDSSDLDLLYQVEKGKTMPLMRLQKLELYISSLLNGNKIELVLVIMLSQSLIRAFKKKVSLYSRPSLYSAFL